MTGAGLAQGLVDRLGRHYIKPGRGGGVFVSEVGTNDWGATGSRCDAIFIGFTSTSGKLLVGHEVKISRSDWLHELDQPGKADFWHDNCHAWYVVAPAPAIVKPEELPPGWGLMLPSPRSSVRFDIAVKATVRDEVCPSWLAVRSIMARQDTQQHAALTEARAAGAQTVLAKVVKDWRGYPGSTGAAELDRLLRALLDLAVKADRERSAHFGGLNLRDLLERVSARLNDDGMRWDATPQIIIDTIADHMLVSRATRQLSRELIERGHSARRLLAALPEHLAAVIALAEQHADELADDA